MRNFAALFLRYINVMIPTSQNVWRVILTTAVAFVTFLAYLKNFSAHIKLGQLFYLNETNWTSLAIGKTFKEQIEDEEYDHSVTKYIFDWTTFFGKPFGPDWMTECPELNCTFTRDASKWNDSEAVIFHMASDFNYQNLPLNRRTNQYFVFLLLESPHHTYVNLNALKSYFNLTVTYRQDSDFYLPYGNIRPISSHIMPNYTSEIEAVAKGKKKLVAWIVGNCDATSKRQDYVHELKKYINVDVFGRCGSLTCSSDCGQILNDDYKFYLSFENSLCKDYTTEKLFKWMKYSVVPIVLSRKYSSNANLPPQSVIAADEFCSAKDLADYLHYLDRNLTAYLEYFWWRTKFESGPLFSCEPKDADHCGLCGLCKFLFKKRRPTKILRNVQRWWVKKAQCTTDLVPNLLSSSKQSSGRDNATGTRNCYSNKNFPS